MANPGRKGDRQASGPRTHLVKLSPAGQITLPAAIRRLPKAEGATFYRLTELDPAAGTYVLEPVPALDAVFARHAGKFGSGLAADLASLRSAENATLEAPARKKTR